MRPVMPSEARPVPPDHDVRRTWLRERVRTGLWFIPAVAIAAAVVASWAMYQLDIELGGDRPHALAFEGDADRANAILGTIAGSTLTFTGIVFSITAVALQLGSSQFSPRALRTFLRDRGTQWALGVLVATFTYALLTLLRVDTHAARNELAVPGLSVSLALALVLASLVTFVLFVNHLTQSIRAVSIIERIAGETRDAVRDAIPDGPPGPEPPPPDGPPDQVVTWDRGPAVLIGYDEDDLVELARQSGAQLRLVHRIGDYLPSGVPAVEVWGGPVDPRQVLRLLGGGIERTMTQDPMFGFRQLVDIAEKALSPALNDPTTAVQSIDRLHDLLRRIGTRPQPTGAHADADGEMRLVVPVPDWEDFVTLACDEIRHFGAPSLQAVRRLRAMLIDLATVVPPERRAVLDRQHGLLDHAADLAFAHESDRTAARAGDHQGLGD
jgi:uncharacterized membrane protein